MSNRERVMIRFLDAVDWLINCVLRIILVGILGISIFSLYDTYKIYDDASSGNLYTRYRPLSDGNAGLSFGELMELNPDVVGWITLDDTNIDYPVVQSDDNSWYLNRDALGNYSLAGSIFMDMNNASDFSDPYTLLYGHHMEHDVMFGGLDHFTNPVYFESHRTGKLWISDNDYYNLTVIACLVTDAYDKHVFQVTPDNEEFLSSQYEYIQQQAVCSADDWDEEIPLLGLSTCTNAGTNKRTVVFCTINDLIHDEEETYETSD